MSCSFSYDNYTKLPEILMSTMVASTVCNRCRQQLLLTILQYHLIIKETLSMLIYIGYAKSNLRLSIDYT